MATASGEKGPGVAQGSRADDPTVAEWAFYIYMAADNSLSDEAYDDLLEMEQVGSRPGELEIVTLSDFKLVSGQGDTNSYRNGTTRIYHVEQGHSRSLPLSRVNASWKYELDLGEGTTLAQFLIWATQEYPARNRALVIWDHGSGWKKVAEDQEGSYLLMPEIGEALAQVNVSFELIGFDACLMAMTEISHTLAPYTRFVLGSQAYEPSDGWTYDTMLGNFLADLQTSGPEALAAGLVDDYIESYRNGSVTTGFSVTYSALDAGQLERLDSALEELTAWLVNLSRLYNLRLDEARAATQTYRDGDYRDLYDLTLELEKRIDIPQFKHTTRMLREALDRAVVAEDHWRAPSLRQVGDSHGQSIYFPASSIRGGYRDLSFARATRWDEFLELFHHPGTPQASLNTTSVQLQDLDGDGYNDSLAWQAGYRDAQVGGRLQAQLVDSRFRVVASFNHTLNSSQDELAGKPFRPRASGNYRLQLLLFDELGMLERMVLLGPYHLDLRLPDVVVTGLELRYQGLALSSPLVGDQVLVRVGLTNRGTTPAGPGNLSLWFPSGWSLVKAYDELAPEASRVLDFRWSPRDAGPRQLRVVAQAAPLQVESDLDNNALERTFQVLPSTPSPFQVKLNLELERRLGLDANRTAFRAGRFNVTLINQAAGPFDNITLVGQTPPGWSLDLPAGPVLLASQASTTLSVGFQAPFESGAGDYELRLWPVSRDGSPGAVRSLTARVPGYSGAAMTATLDRARLRPGQTALVTIVMTNLGNGEAELTLVDEVVPLIGSQLDSGYFRVPAFATVNTTARLSVDRSLAAGEYPLTFTLQNASAGKQIVSVTLLLPVEVDESSSPGWSTASSLLVMVTVVLLRSRFRGKAPRAG